MEKLSHTDLSGKAVMIDIGSKEIQQRTAKASGHIRIAVETLKLIEDNLLKKGDVLTVAQLAGINAAKETSRLIPLCHNINLDYIKVNLHPDNNGIVAESEIHCSGRTGAEMEALSAVAVSLLTVYDMCKAVDKMMVIDRIMLTEKSKR
jgi:cyclic pyranopterin monophosphate synthase